jgi:hypothetical protein
MWKMGNNLLHQGLLCIKYLYTIFLFFNLEIVCFNIVFVVK